ncbi:MAG: putative sulfurtransferase [Candidatus Tokpelaia sp. JSC161]|jgi:UPF0176 protein|nr:MAG: putative sulfurtransferase [Candidatus Tokpelaia sp. JSC161]
MINMRHNCLATLYCFSSLSFFADLQKPLLFFCKKNAVLGTLVLASEGINGTICGSEEAVEEVLAFIKCLLKCGSLELKYFRVSEVPFRRMKVRLKKEIVTMGVEGINPLNKVGIYASPKEWNILIRKKDTLLIDVRNSYEYAIGTFEGALNPNLKKFRDFPVWVREHMIVLKKKKSIAMFCTGGIRCEKSTSYMRNLGFDSVYHLKGGILRYFADIPLEETLWKGKCFVFDQRGAIGFS